MSRKESEKMTTKKEAVKKILTEDWLSVILALLLVFLILPLVPLGW